MRQSLASPWVWLESQGSWERTASLGLGNGWGWKRLESAHITSK